MTLKIHEQFTKIILCQVVPGHETDVLSQFAKLDPHPDALLAFGEFDLVGISTGYFNSIEGDEILSVVAPYIRDYQEVLCFRWDDIPPLPKDRGAYPVWGVSFLKLNLPPDSQWDIEHEFNVSKWLFNYQKIVFEEAHARQVQLTVMGSLGWPEVVVFWASYSFEAIISSVLTLRQKTWKDLHKLGLDFAPDVRSAVFSSSYTIPGVLLAAPTNPNWERDPNLKNVTGYIEATLLIKGAGSSNAQIIEKLANSWDRSSSIAQEVKPGERKQPAKQGTSFETEKFINFKSVFDASFVFGQHDIRLTPKSRSISIDQLTRAIKIARSIPEVQLTRTVLSFSQVSPAQNTNAQTEDFSRQNDVSNFKQRHDKYRDWLKALRDLEKRLENTWMGVEAQLSQVLARYNTVLANPDFIGLFDDMENFIDHAFTSIGRYVYEEPYLVWSDPVTRQRFERFAHVSRIFQIGFEQRLNGAQVGRTNSSRAFTSLRAYGVHRVIWAANAVAISSMSRFHSDGWRPFDWYGFTVFGYPKESLRLSFGVINLRLADLFRPDQWWAIVHACGHEFYELANWRRHPTVSNIINHLTEHFAQLYAHSSRLTCHALAQHIVEELVADIVTFHIAFDSNWAMYQQQVWSLLNLRFDGTQDEAELFEHLVRSVFVYFYALEWQNSLAPGRSVSSAIALGQKMGQLLFSTPEHTGGTPIANDPTHNFVSRKLSEWNSLDGVIGEIICNEFARQTPRAAHLFERIAVADVATTYHNLESLRHFFRNEMKKCLDEKSERNDLTKLATRLFKGEVVLDDNIDSIDILNAATICANRKENGKSPWVIACLLSIRRHTK